VTINTQNVLKLTVAKRRLAPCAVAERSASENKEGKGG